MFPHHKLLANILIYNLRVYFWERKQFKLKIICTFCTGFDSLYRHYGLKSVIELILLFITTALAEAEVSASRPGRSLTPRRHATHCTGGCVVQRAGLDRCEKSHPYRVSMHGPSIPKPVAIPTKLPSPQLIRE